MVFRCPEVAVLFGPEEVVSGCRYVVPWCSRMIAVVGCEEVVAGGRCVISWCCGVVCGCFDVGSFGLVMACNGGGELFSSSGREVDCRGQICVRGIRDGGRSGGVREHRPLPVF